MNPLELVLAALQLADKIAQQNKLSFEDAVTNYRKNRDSFNAKNDARRDELRKQVNKKQ